MASGCKIHKVGTCKKEVNRGGGDSFSHLLLHASFSSLKTKNTEETEVTDQRPRRECERKALQRSHPVSWCFQNTKSRISWADRSLECLTQSPKPGGRLREMLHRTLWVHALQRAHEVYGSSPQRMYQRAKLAHNFRIPMLILNPLHV